MITMQQTSLPFDFLFFLTKYIQQEAKINVTDVQDTELLSDTCYLCVIILKAQISGTSDQKPH